MRFEQHLDGQVAAEVDVSSLEHGPHAAAGDLTEDLIASPAAPTAGHLGRRRLEDRSGTVLDLGVAQQHHGARRRWFRRSEPWRWKQPAQATWRARHRGMAHSVRLSPAPGSEPPPVCSIKQGGQSPTALPAGRGTAAHREQRGMSVMRGSPSGRRKSICSDIFGHRQLGVTVADRDKGHPQPSESRQITTNRSCFPKYSEKVGKGTPARRRWPPCRPATACPRSSRRPRTCWVRRTDTSDYHDPAMLIWLDARSNHKGNANENLARADGALQPGHRPLHRARRQGGRPPSPVGMSITRSSPRSPIAMTRQRRSSWARPGAGRG